MGGEKGDIGKKEFNIEYFVKGIKIDSIEEDIESFVEGRRMEENENVMMSFEGGEKGMIWWRKVEKGNENEMSMRVYGKKGGIEWEKEDKKRMWLKNFGEKKRIIKRGGEGVGKEEKRVKRVKEGKKEGYMEDFEKIY